MRRLSALLSPADKPLVHLGLLGLTALTTFFTHAYSLGEGWMLVRGSLGAAATFSVALLAILGAHEMGHYLFARRHGVDSSLPYFIPVPLAFGTLGAVIRIRSPIPNRNALVDIGAAGPLAGLAVAIPVLLFGYARAAVGDFPPVPAHFPGEMSLWVAGPKLVAALWDLLRDAPASGGPEAWANIYGDNLFTLGIERLMVGVLPVGKVTMANALIEAGWFGLLMTMMNLIPIGQLDGGHLAFALFGERARWVGRLMALGLVGLTLFASWTWILWLVLTTKVVGFRHPEVTEPLAPLSRGRVWICALCAVALVLCLMPVPIGQVVVR